METLEDGAQIDTPRGKFRLEIIEGDAGSLRFHLHEEDADAPANRSAIDPRVELERAMAPYDEFARRQAGLQPADYARVQEAVFRLMTGLCSDALGSHLWCLVNRAHAGDQSSRAIYPLIRAWSAIRPDVARALLDTLLHEQAADGSIPLHPLQPAIADAVGPFLPYLAHGFRIIARGGVDRAWFEFAMPGIQRHLEYTILHADPDREGLPIWPDPNDAVVPELYEADRVSTDLVSLLIREIDALEFVAGSFAITSVNFTELLTYRDLLKVRLRDFLWSPEHAAFWDRYRDGRPVLRQTISAVAPLLTEGLTPTERTSALTALMSRQQLFSDAGLRSWAPWPDDETEPSIAPLAQLLLLEALDESSAHAEAAALRSALANNADPLDSTERVALCIDTLALPPDTSLKIQALSPMLLWLDRHRMGVLIAVALGFVLLNVVILFAMTRRSTVMPQTLETNVGLARRYYQEGQYEEAERLTAQIIATPQRHESAYLEMGNILYRQGKWAEAEAAYRAQQGKPHIVAQARHNLAVLLNEQNRQQEAIALWRDIEATFGQSVPAVSQRARTALQLIDPAGQAAQRE